MRWCSYWQQGQASSKSVPAAVGYSVCTIPGETMDLIRQLEQEEIVSSNKTNPRSPW